MDAEQSRKYRAKTKRTRDNNRQRRKKRCADIQTKMDAFKVQRLKFQIKEFQGTPLEKLGFTMRRFTATMPQSLDDNMAAAVSSSDAATKQADDGYDYYIPQPPDPLDNEPPT